MTKESLAALLNGREYGNEITKDEESEAKKSGLVVIFGYSDDNAELRGAFKDEVPCYGGAVIKLHRTGPLEPHEESCDCPFCAYEEIAQKCADVSAVWSGKEGYSWTYETNIPHATFQIIEEDHVYCQGIVFEASSLPVL